MTESAGTFVCRRGDMELSLATRDALRAIIDNDSSLVPVSTPSVRRGGSWHCPADGKLMEESGGTVRCPACHRCLSGAVLYQLVEFHVHRPLG